MTTINTALHNAIIADLKAGDALGKAQDKQSNTRSMFNAELKNQGVKATDWLSPRGKDNGSTSTIEWYDGIRRLVVKDGQGCVWAYGSHPMCVHMGYIEQRKW